MDTVERIARRVNRKFFRAAEERSVVRPEKYREILDAETSEEELMAIRREIATKAAELRQRKVEYKRKRA